MMVQTQNSTFHVLFKVAVGLLIFGGTVGLEALRHAH
jgi:hypothetical protein